MRVSPSIWDSSSCRRSRACRRLVPISNTRGSLRRSGQCGAHRGEAPVLLERRGPGEWLRRRLATDRKEAAPWQPLRSRSFSGAGSGGSLIPAATVAPVGVALLALWSLVVSAVLFVHPTQGRSPRE